MVMGRRDGGENNKGIKDSQANIFEGLIRVSYISYQC